jgi:hypothetical protein
MSEVRPNELYISLMDDAEREAARNFDKAVLALASGAFGVTVIFVREVAPEIRPDVVPWLICSWTMFAASILSTLLSLLFGQYACRARRDEASRSSSGELLDIPPEPWTVKAVDVLNICSLFLLAAGFTLWMVFVTYSLKQVNDGEKHTNSEPVDLIDQARNPSAV